MYRSSPRPTTLKMPEMTVEICTPVTATLDFGVLQHQPSASDDSAPEIRRFADTQVESEDY